MSGVAMVTGATGVIGGAIARGLVERGWEVVLACRDRERADASARSLGPRACVEVVDVSRPDSVRALGDRFDGPLDVLVNNAAVTPRKRSETPDGIELQWATNVLGYVWMLDALLPALRRGDAPRVVNVASYWAGGLDLDDLQFERRRYDNDAAYRQSKQANRMLTVALAEELPGIAVNACHPGDVPSTLARNLGFGGGDTAEEAAATPILVATMSERTTGRWFEHARESTCRFASDRAAIAALRDAVR
jgi:retinol dehydrogenase-12